MSVAALVANRTPLDDYASLLGASEIDELRALARPLRGRTVQMVNSTQVGGGVAEILSRLVPLAQELGLDVRWDVMQGGPDFFEVTKAFHNALHGGAYTPSANDFEIFRHYSEINRARLAFDAEFTVIHDPQPAALVDGRVRGQGHWIWRCHIDLSRPHRHVWEFLEPYVLRHDCAVFSSPDHSRQLPLPQFLFYPAIDPLSEKNRDLDRRVVAQVLARHGIDPERPIVTQISRFDRLKDPVGVIRAYRLVKRHADCQLVLAGGGADDDPEGAAVLGEVRAAANDDPDIHVLALPATASLEVNALQRGATIIVQKSLREGFGLTVTEALWKRKPVVASAVGGIPVQVVHGQTGLLAHSVEGTASHIRYLLANPAIARAFGERGHDHVREHFVITRNLRSYLVLFQWLAGIGSRR